MIVAFFESIRYVGHTVPLVVLRVYIGYYYFATGWSRFTGEDLVKPKLAGLLNDAIVAGQLSPTMQWLSENYIIPNWWLWTYILACGELIVGLLLCIGFLNRPVSIVGFLLAWFWLFIANGLETQLLSLHMVIFVVLFWFGSGRCLGFDYYFYKRQRGLWW